MIKFFVNRFNKIVQRRNETSRQLLDAYDKISQKIGEAAEAHAAIDWVSLVARRACLNASKHELSLFNIWVEFFTGYKR